MITGTDVLRRVIEVRNKKFHLGSFARDLGIAVTDLEDFGRGKVDLPADVKTRIAKELLGDNVEFIEATDKLRRLDPPALPLGKPAAQWLPEFEFSSPAGPAPKPVVPVKPAVQAKLPGWE